MNHALIIDDNMIISRGIQSRLEGLGFTSFDHTWTEEQAVTAARRCTPNLVIVGDEVASGSVLSAIRRISSEMTVPFLMVSGDPVRAERHLAKVAAFEGPFLLSQIEEAVNIAIAAPGTHSRDARPRLAHVPTHRTGARPIKPLGDSREAMATQPSVPPSRIEPLAPLEAPYVMSEPIYTEPDV